MLKRLLPIAPPISRPRLSAAAALLAVLTAPSPARAQEHTVDCTVFCANEFVAGGAQNGQNCNGIVFVKKNETPVNLSWRGAPTNSCCGPAGFHCKARSWATSQCNCQPPPLNGPTPAGQCRGDTGPGGNFVFNCDLICHNPSPSTNPCAGVFWKNERGVFKATNSGKLDSGNCAFETHHQDAKVGLNVCGCEWYGNTTNRCEITHDWMVECSTYCTNQLLVSDGTNCHGVYWIDGDGHWQFTRPSGDKACKDAGATRSIKRADIDAKCGNCQDPMLKPPNIPAAPSPAVDFAKARTAPMSKATLDQLHVLRDQIRGWVRCADWDECDKLPENNRMNCSAAQIRACASYPPVVPAGGASKPVGAMYEPDVSPFFIGDSLGSAGMACLGGEKARCNDVRIAQDRTGAFGPKGAFYRSAAHMHVTGDYSKFADAPAFSRDHMIGVMAYWLAAKDFESIDLWLDFVKDNERQSKAFLNLCPRKTGANLDDRCNIVPSTWANIYRVLKHIGYDMQKVQGKLGNAIMTGPDLDLITNNVEAATAPVMGPSGYMGADTFAVALIYYLMGFPMTNTFRELNNRTDERHPFYHLMASGKPTEWLGFLVKAYCPPAMPPYGAWGPSVTDRTLSAQRPPDMAMRRSSTMLVWNYQTWGGRGPYGRWAMTNGHECIDLINWIDKMVPVTVKPGSGAVTPK